MNSYRYLILIVAYHSYCFSGLRTCSAEGEDWTIQFDEEQESNNGNETEVIISLNSCLDDPELESNQTTPIPSHLILSKLDESHNHILKISRNNQLSKLDNCSTVSLKSLNFSMMNLPTENENDTTPRKTKAIFTLEGFAIINHVFIPPDAFCVQNHRIQDDIVEMTLKYCEPNCTSSSEICIRKCCPPEEIISTEHDWSCVRSSSEKWKPWIIESDNFRGCGQQSSHSDQIHYLQPQFACKNGQQTSISLLKTIQDILQEAHETLRFRLLRNGSVVVDLTKGNWMVLESGTYCIDGFQISENETYTGHPHDQLLIKCEDGNNESTGVSFDEYLYPSMMFIGAVFLFTTSLIYLILWDKHNTHGWTIFSLVTSMLFMFIFVGTAKIMSISLNEEDGGSSRCVAIGLLAHFFFLSTFCWMTMINVDLWWTFRRLSPATGRMKGWRMFFSFLVFSWGVPFLIVIIGLSLDAFIKAKFHHIEGKDCEVNSWIISPEYGINTCYISEPAMIPYLYVPIGFLLAVNLLLFSFTVATLCKYRQSTKAAARNSKNKNQKQSFWLFVKLFVVMGISWTFELISFISNYHDKSNKSHWYWVPFDIVNMFQGVLIFFFFACKRENLLHFHQKYPKRRWLVDPILKLRWCKTRVMSPETTEMTNADKSRVLYRHSTSEF